MVGQPVAGAPGELLGLDAGHVDARIDMQPSAAELQPAGDPCQRLTLLATAQPFLEHALVRGRRHQLVGLLLGCEAAGRAQARGQSLDL
jgi:hypothetical protein